VVTGDTQTRRSNCISLYVQDKIPTYNTSIVRGSVDSVLVFSILLMKSVFECTTSGAASEFPRRENVAAVAI
jgi:hypothetical protein